MYVYITFGYGKEAGGKRASFRCRTLVHTGDTDNRHPSSQEHDRSRGREASDSSIINQIIKLPLELLWRKTMDTLFQAPAIRTANSGKPDLIIINREHPRIIKRTCLLPRDHFNRDIPTAQNTAYGILRPPTGITITASQYNYTLHRKHKRGSI